MPHSHTVRQRLTYVGVRLQQVHVHVNDMQVVRKYRVVQKMCKKSFTYLQ